ncbi:hypothetical protein AX15_004504 [Amanita polypyramis BW_CC]|nr:hypothetical protein AX15_004504 [Amanita polypyramis BW_CC]
MADDLLTAHDPIQLFIDALPALTGDELASLAEDACPICLVPFVALNNSTVTTSERTVTKLIECGHVFCRKDLVEWIRGRHGSCPTCRHTFLNVRPPSESDDESSDGGEYMPNSDDIEDEEDGFLDTDGFTDVDAEDFTEDDPDIFNDVWDGTTVDDIYEDALDFDEDVEAEGDACEEWGLQEGDPDPGFISRSP